MKPQFTTSNVIPHISRSYFILHSYNQLKNLKQIIMLPFILGTV